MLDAVSAGATSMATLPLTNVELIMMTMPHSRKEEQVIRGIYERGGFGGFWAGNGISLLHDITFSVVRTLTNGLVHDKLYNGGRLTRCEKLNTNLISLVATTAITYPLDMLRVRMLSNPKRYESFSDLFKVRITGRNVINAITATGLSLLSIAPSILINSYLSRFLGSRFHISGRMTTHLVHGVCCAIGEVVVYPMKLLARNLALTKDDGTPLYDNPIQALTSITKEEGICGLYKGCRMAALRAITWNMLYPGIRYHMCRSMKKLKIKV